MTAKSMKSFATTLNDGSGVGSGVLSGPCSNGRGIKAVLCPERAAARRSPW